MNCSLCQPHDSQHLSLLFKTEHILTIFGKQILDRMSENPHSLVLETLKQVLRSLRQMYRVISEFKFLRLSHSIYPFCSWTGFYLAVNLDFLSRRHGFSSPDR